MGGKEAESTGGFFDSYLMVPKPTTSNLHKQ